MASQPQPLPPALPCASPTGAGGAGLAANSPEKGTAHPKPPVRPKPRVLPKPAVPAKPSLPQPPPGPRHPRPELPSAEKLNRLAGPQPYSAGGAGGPVRRPSFTIKSPETSNGKGLPSPPAAAAEDSGSIPGEEVPPTLLTPPRKSPSPFKVTPVPVATKPERFPGTTVEEILAKMDSREGPGSPDRARLSPFCPDPSPRFGSKTFSAFRRRPSGAADGTPPAEPHQTPQPVAGELGKEHDGHRVAETSSRSPPAGPSCAGDPRGCRRPPSPADLSSLQPSALGAPGSPRHPTSPAPGAPFQPTQPPISAPGSPDAPAELPTPGSPTPAPNSPESPAQPPAEVPATPNQAPGAPCSTAEPWPGASRSPGSPHTPGEGSPDTGSPPTTPELPPRVTCPPGSPESAAERWGPPSPAREPPVKVSCPPGSPEGPDDSSASPQSRKGPDSSPPPPSRDSGLRRCSEGLLQPLPVGQGLGELGGSLSTLPRPGDPPPELSLGGWSLSQSFEWTFPGQGAQRLVSPPCSPIRETPDLGLSIECELDGGDPAPRPSCSRGNSGSEEPCPAMASSWAAEGAPCPGGPVAQREAEGSAEEEEGEAEQDATVSCSPLCVMEPGQDPAEPEPPAQPNCPIMAAPMDPAPTDPDPTDPPPAAELAWAPVGDRPGSLQGPGGPGRAEGPSKGADPHADPGWLMELLASPRAQRTGLGSPNAEGLEDQLSWSPKGLCGDFGAGSPHHGTFSWSCEAVARERDWPGETERDRDPETKPDWGSAHGAGDGDRQDRPFGSPRRDWGSAYQGTELTGETRLGCSDWPESRGTGESCRQDQDFGAGKPQWGGGEESGSGRADWSSGCGPGHGQQRDREPGSRHHSWAGMYGSGHPERRDGDITSAWAGEYSAGNVEMKDRDLSLGWTREYSSRDPETKDEDLTLGWAGRSSTGDTGTPEKEFSPSRVAWDSEYSAQDMESQDREFSPSRPAWTGDTSTRDMESQDREFSPSRPAWTGDTSTRDMESQDREFSPSRPAWTGDTSTRDMENQDREFSPSRPAWTGDTSTRDMESQDREFSPSRPAWTGDTSTRDMESQDREFSPSRPAWTGDTSTRDMESQDREFSPSRPAWTGDTSTRDMESQDREFSPSRPAWTGDTSTRDMESQDREFSPSRPAWTGDTSTRDMESQDREFSPSRPAWTGDTSTRDMENQDREFSPSRPAWTGDTSTRDMESQDREFSPSRPAWTGDTSTRDMESQDREFSPSRPAWAGDTSTRDMESQDREFSPSRPAWTGDTSTRDMESQDREFSPRRPAWTGDTSTRDMESQDREFSPSRPAWTGDTSTRDMESQDREFSPSRPAWAGDTSTRDMESQDREFSPSRPAWTGDTSTRDMESQDREFSPSRPAWTGDTSTRDMESQDREFSPSRPAWTGDTSTRDMEMQDREFSPSQPAWDDEHRTRDVEMQDEEFSSSRVAWASEGSSREVESRDSGCKPGRPSWDSGYSTGDVGSQDREFSPSQAAQVSESGSANTAKEGEFSHERLSWAGERSLGQTELVSAFGVGKDDASGCHGPEAPEPGWGSTGRQECDVTGSRDWAGELGGAERHNQFGVIGTERVPEPCSARAPSDGSVSWAGGLGEPLGAWHRALDFGSSGTGGAGTVGLGQPAWGTGLGSLAVPNTPPAPNTLPAPSALPTPGSAGLEEPGWSGGCDTEAVRQEWASAFGARCAARSRDFSAVEQSLGGYASSTDGTLHLSAPSPPVGDTLAVPRIEECPRSEPPSPTEEEQDIPAPADPPHGPSLRAAGGSLPDSESEGSPAEHPDGGSPPSGQGEQPCPAGPLDCAGQDFSFLEDTAVLDSSVYRSKASLGRKRPHRAPALRPAAAAEGDSWIFRDSTEPRPARPDASSDEEAVEEPRSRRVRASPLGRGVKVPLFPSLSASALKAKLRGRNRSAEEGAVPGDGKATPPRDPHVQRSKSCKIPGLSGKPLALPPKPDKSSGSDASPPHWLQALKLKKKKP